MSEMTGWEYYKRALLPTTPPDEPVDTTLIESGEIWKGTDAFFARWTSDFDCGYETPWWYVIKTEPFDIGTLNAKKRYKVNRGSRYFDVRQIKPEEYLEEIYRVQVEAYKDYPEKYRPTVDKEKLFRTIQTEWTSTEIMVFGAFHRESGDLDGYIQLSVTGKCIYSNAQKAVPAQEKYQINYALLAGVLDTLRPMLESGYYISVGSRNIQHETAFQDFVEDIFGFRKAYCKLHIAYHPKLRWMIPALYRMRGILKKLDHVGLVHKINGVLVMEEFLRQ